MAYISFQTSPPGGFQVEQVKIAPGGKGEAVSRIFLCVFRWSGGERRHQDTLVKLTDERRDVSTEN